MTTGDTDIQSNPALRDEAGRRLSDGELLTRHGGDLFWSSRSPAARKVMVVAHENDLQHLLRLRRVSVGFATPNPEVMKFNPLNKIPTLVLGDGTTIFDSRVICRLFTSLGASTANLGDGLPAIRSSVWEALGDGLADLSMLKLGEGRRADGTRSDPHLKAFIFKIGECLDYLEAHIDRLRLEGVTVGSLMIAVALSHIDFRHGELGWRERRPRLAEWFDRMSSRSSFEATAFDDVV